MMPVARRLADPPPLRRLAWCSRQFGWFAWHVHWTRRRAALGL